MAQRVLWHLVEQRIRDAEKGGTKECENVVRECKAMAEEELWLGWNQGRVTGPKNNKGNWQKSKQGIKREGWEVRHNDAILGRCSFDCHENCHRVELWD